jgi:hypothetical protein
VTDGTHDVGGDIDVELRPYFRGLRTVEAVVGRDTVPFLFDTGGGVTVISPEVARSIGCAPFGRMIGHRMTGEPVEFQRCDSVEIVVGALKLSHAPVAVLDVNALLPAELPKLGGVLSLDSFRGRILLIDWPAGRVTVRDASARAPADFPASLPLRFATGDNGESLVVLVPVSGTRGPLWLLLDSGNIRGTLLGRHVVRETLVPLDGERAQLTLPGGSSWVAEFEALSLILDGVLGVAFLERGPVVLDLRFAPTDPVP